MAEERKTIELPKESQIQKSGFTSFMSTLFGFRRNSDPVGNKTSGPIIPVKVDIDSNERVGQAFLGQVFTTGPMSEKLNKLLEAYYQDSDKYAEVSGRKTRVDQITYAITTDPLISRTVQLYADEATQIDDQDTLIQIESADPKMTRDMYMLLNQWGVTPTRVWDAMYQLGAYGDAFWANKVTDKGVESIYPLQQLVISDRLEFSPSKVMEKEKLRQGGFGNLASNNYLIQQMLDTMEDMDGDFASLFETKLFGFCLDNDTVAPPWDVTHFRVGSESGRFFPWGTSPILGALAPYKEVSSMMALNNLARQMNFPITLYKVKTTENMDESKQFSVLNNVREAYDNIGVNPGIGGSEVYTVNTKIWLPDGLLNVETVSPRADTDDYKDDIELRQQREAIALSLPEAFFNGDFYGSGYVSAKSLVQQYKPLRRRVFSLQNAFLQGLSELFRLHFAITGDHDFREPFTLSMRYPAEEIDSEINSARSNSIETVANIIDMIKGAIGLDDEEGLPPDIVKDIIMKYSFLDPSDVIKWTRDAKYSKSFNTSKSSADKDPFEAEDGESFDFNPMDNPPAEEEPADGNADVSEPLYNGSLTKPRQDPMAGLTSESRHLSDQERLREKQLVKIYEANRDAMYIQALRENNIHTFQRGEYAVQMFDTIPSDKELMYEVLAKQHKGQKLREGISGSKSNPDGKESPSN